MTFLFCQRPWRTLGLDNFVTQSIETLVLVFVFKWWFISTMLRILLLLLLLLRQAVAAMKTFCPRQCTNNNSQFIRNLWHKLSTCSTYFWRPVPNIWANINYNWTGNNRILLQIQKARCDGECRALITLEESPSLPSVPGNWSQEVLFVCLWNKLICVKGILSINSLSET